MNEWNNGSKQRNKDEKILQGRNSCFYFGGYTLQEINLKKKKTSFESSLARHAVQRLTFKHWTVINLRTCATVCVFSVHTRFVFINFYPERHLFA